MATRRQYAGAAVQTTITSSLNASATSIDIASTTGWPSGATAYFVVISPGTTSEEKCLATRASSTLTLTRGQDGTTGQTHASGATIYPVFTATDADEANELASVMTTKGDIISRSSSVPTRLAVGTNGQVLVADSSTTSGLNWRNPLGLIDSQTFTSSTTYTLPAGAAFVYVECIAAGGGGGGGARNTGTSFSDGGGGGAGGPYYQQILTATSLGGGGASITVTIGSGGSGGTGRTGSTGSGTDGVRGGQSRFGVAYFAGGGWGAGGGTSGDSLNGGVGYNSIAGFAMYPEGSFGSGYGRVGYLGGGGGGQGADRTTTNINGNAGAKTFGEPKLSTGTVGNTAQDSNEVGNSDGAAGTAGGGNGGNASTAGGGGGGGGSNNGAAGGNGGNGANYGGGGGGGAGANGNGNGGNGGTGGNAQIKIEVYG